MDKKFNLPPNFFDPTKGLAASCIASELALFVEKANDFLFDVARPIEMPDGIITCGKELISSAQNLTIITGQSKSGKTGLFAALLAGTINSKCDTLGFNVQCNLSGKLVIHIDSEQSDYNHYKAAKGILNRANVESQPLWFKSYLFRKLPIAIRKEYLTNLLDHWSNEFNGVHSIFIDGVADFCNTVNDEIVANETILFFEEIAIKFNCPIIAVLHLNPATITGKSRGHLGSQLERKCESMLLISKEKDSGVSIIEEKYLRNGGSIPKIEFKFDVELGYHVLIGSKKHPTKEDRKRWEIAQMVIDVFKNGEMKFLNKDLILEIMEIYGVKRDMAKKYITQMYKEKFIEHEGDIRSKIRMCNGVKLVDSETDKPK